MFVNGDVMMRHPMMSQHSILKATGEEYKKN